jgi:hypothetical protein
MCVKTGSASNSMLVIHFPCESLQTQRVSTSALLASSTFEQWGDVESAASYNERSCREANAVRSAAVNHSGFRAVPTPADLLTPAVNHSGMQCRSHAPRRTCSPDTLSSSQQVLLCQQSEGPNHDNTCVQSFWQPQDTPNSDIRPDKPSMDILCPVSGKKLRLKDLTAVKFTPVPEGSEGQFMDPISQDAFTNSSHIVILKPTGDTVLAKTYRTCIKPDGHYNGVFTISGLPGPSGRLYLCEQLQAQLPIFLLPYGSDVCPGLAAAFAGC